MSTNLTPFSPRTAPVGGGVAVIFHHIYKCAGSSLREHLIANLDAVYHPLYTHRDWVELDRRMGDLTAQNRQDRQDRGVLLCGHEAWGAHELLPRDMQVHYLTFLRDPVRLFHSQWNYWLLKCGEVINTEKARRMLPSNTMVGYLANGSLPLAMERLENAYSFFGVVDRFAESLDMLRLRFGMPAGEVRNKNVSRVELQPLTDEIRELALEQNPLDTELYAFAMELFEERREAMGVPLREAKPKKPKPARASTEKPLWELQQDDPERALAIMKDHARDADVAKNMGRLHATLGDEENARVWLRRAFEQYPAFYPDYSDLLLRCAPEEGARFLQGELERMAGIASMVRDSCLNRIRLDMQLRISLRGGLDPEQALHAVRQARRIDPDNFEALQHEAVLLRKAGEHAAAAGELRSFLERSTDTDRRVKALLELIPTLHEAGEQAQANAYAAQYKALASLDFPNEYGRRPEVAEAFSLDQLLEQGDRVLAVRCAPLYAVSYFADAVRQAPQQPDLLIQTSHNDFARSLGAFADVIRTPDAMFSFADMDAALLSRLRAKAYDTVVLLSSHMDLDYYAQWLLLARDLTDKVCFFPRENALLGERQCFEPDSEALRQALL